MDSIHEEAGNKSMRPHPPPPPVPNARMPPPPSEHHLPHVSWIQQPFSSLPIIWPDPLTYSPRALFFWKIGHLPCDLLARRHRAEPLFGSLPADAQGEARPSCSPLRPPPLPFPPTADHVRSLESEHARAAAYLRLCTRRTFFLKPLPTLSFTPPPLPIPRTTASR